MIAELSQVIMEKTQGLNQVSNQSFSKKYNINVEKSGLVIPS